MHCPWPLPIFKSVWHFCDLIIHIDRRHDLFFIAEDTPSNGRRWFSRIGKWLTVFPRRHAMTLLSRQIWREILSQQSIHFGWLILMIVLRLFVVFCDLGSVIYMTFAPRLGLAENIFACGGEWFEKFDQNQFQVGFFKYSNVYMLQFKCLL